MVGFFDFGAMYVTVVNRLMQKRGSGRHRLRLSGVHDLEGGRLGHRLLHLRQGLLAEHV